MDFPPLGFTDDVLLCRRLKVMRSRLHLYTHSEALVVHRKCSTANNVILQLPLWTFVIFKQTNNPTHINSIVVQFIFSPAAIRTKVQQLQTDAATKRECISVSTMNTCVPVTES